MPTKTQPRIVRDILQRHAADLVVQLQCPGAIRKVNTYNIVKAMETACVEAMTKCCDMVLGEEPKRTGFKYNKGEDVFVHRSNIEEE